MIEILGVTLALLVSGVAVGFVPGFVLRPFLCIYPKGSERPAEILGELYSLPFMKRIPWAFQHVEVAIFDGGRERIEARQMRRRFKVRKPFPYSVERVDDHSVRIVNLGDEVLTTVILGSMSVSASRASRDDPLLDDLVKALHRFGGPLSPGCAIEFDLRDFGDGDNRLYPG